MSIHPGTKEEINGVTKELSKVGIMQGSKQESKPVLENHQQQSFTPNTSLQSAETNLPDTPNTSISSADTILGTSTQELVKSIPPPRVENNRRLIAIPKPHYNVVKPTEYTPLAEYYAAQSPHHPKLREVRRLESAKAPIDLYRIANRNNNINVPATKLTADISAMFKHSTNTEVRKVISNVLVSTENCLRKIG